VSLYTRILGYLALVLALALVGALGVVLDLVTL
jgi:hypothetical protein